MNADISEIRSLLESYYDGSLSPEEINELQRLLASTPSLPPELEIERRMFQAIDSAVPEPPADLLIRLEQAVDLASTTERRPHRHGIILRVGAIALAAAACLSGVIFLADMTEDLSPSTDPVIIARADLSDTLELTPLAAPDYVEPAVNAPAAEAVTELPVAPAETQAEKPRKARKKRRGARVITDPDEALAYIEATFEKIADDVQTGDRLLETTLIESTYCNIILNQ